jgi:hypothetical protein
MEVEKQALTSEIDKIRFLLKSPSVQPSSQVQTLPVLQHIKMGKGTDKLYVSKLLGAVPPAL